MTRSSLYTIVIVADAMVEDLWLTIPAFLQKKCPDRIEDFLLCSRARKGKTHIAG